MLEVTPTDVTPAGTGGWQLVTMPAGVPIGATGVLLEAYNPLGYAVVAGARTPGVTDSIVDTLYPGERRHLMAGLNGAAKQADLFRNDGVTYRVIGAFGNEWVFFTTLSPLLVQANNTWETKSLAAISGADTATGFAVSIHGAGGFVGLRHPSSTDELVAGNNAPGFLGGSGVWICGCNGAEEVQLRLLNTSYFVTPIAYCKSGLIWNVDAINRGPAAAGAFESLAALPVGQTTGIYRIRGEQAATVRKIGWAEDPYLVSDHQYRLVIGNASRQVEAKVAATTTDIFEMGSLAAATIVAPPTISAAASVREGAALVVTLTNAGSVAGDRLLIARQNGLDIVLAQTAGNATQATVTIDCVRPEPLQSHKFGPLTLVVRRVSDNVEASTALDLQVPVAGQLFTNLTSIASNAAWRLSATPDLVGDEQIFYFGNLAETQAVPAGHTVLPDASVELAPGATPTTFYARAFNPTDRIWGTAGAQSFDVAAITGIGIGSLPQPVAVAAGSVSPPNYTGTAVAALPQLVAQAAGTIGYSGSATVALPQLVAAATGTAAGPGEVTGVGVGSLPQLVAQAAGTVSLGAITGTGLAALPQLAAAATGALGISGAAQASVPQLTALAAGTFVAPTISGAAAASVPQLAAVASGAVAGPGTVLGFGAGALPQLVASGDIQVSAPAFTGAAQASLPQLRASGFGAWTGTPILVDAIGSLPQLEARSSGKFIGPVDGVGVASIPQLIARGDAIDPRFYPLRQRIFNA